MKPLVPLLVVAVGAAGSAFGRAEEKRVAPPFVHVVVFQLKEGAPPQAVDALIAEARALLPTLAPVRGVRIGRRQESPVSKDKRFAVGLVVLFDDAGGLRDYLAHPDFVKFRDKHDRNFSFEVFDFLDQPK